jgi:hypothetical protein
MMNNVKTLFQQIPTFYAFLLKNICIKVKRLGCILIGMLRISVRSNKILPGTIGQSISDFSYSGCLKISSYGMFCI